MLNDKVLKWKCPDCGKLLMALYERQLENQKSVHILNCKREVSK